MTYPVNNIYASIQGEGSQSGIPMIIVRLQGCDVGCPFCDTRETWSLYEPRRREHWSEALGQQALYTNKSASEINAYICDNLRWGFIRWVLITGGEPAIWNLAPLVHALHDGGYKVAIETSGTEQGHIDSGADWITVSPKVGQPGKKHIAAGALESADEIKMVIGKRGDLDTLSQLLDGVHLKDDCQICLQPMSQLPKPTKICVDAVQLHGWRLSIQVHKYIGLE